MLRISIFALPIILVALSFLIKKMRGIDFLVFAHAIINLGFALPLYLNLGEGGVIDKIGLFAFLITAVIYPLRGAIFFGRPAQTNAESTPALFHLFDAVYRGDECSLYGTRPQLDLDIRGSYHHLFRASYQHRKQSKDHRSRLEISLYLQRRHSAGFCGHPALCSRSTSADATLKFEMVNAAVLSPFWLKLSFVFVLIGFGTKIGLAPMHFWLPDAYTHAPSPISALLSGALMNAAPAPTAQDGKDHAARAFGTHRTGYVSHHGLPQRVRSGSFHDEDHGFQAHLSLFFD